MRVKMRPVFSKPGRVIMQSIGREKRKRIEQERSYEENKNMRSSESLYHSSQEVATVSEQIDFRDEYQYDISDIGYEPMYQDDFKATQDQPVDVASSSQDSDNDSTLSNNQGFSDDDPEFCNHCMSGRGWRTLFQCSYCDEWVHVKCYNERVGAVVLDKVPKGLWACRSDSDCQEKYKRLVARGVKEDIHGILCVTENTTSVENVDFDAIEKEHSRMESGGVADELWCVEDIRLVGIGADDVVTKSPLAVVREKLVSLARNEPITFECMKRYIRTLSATKADEYLGIATGILRILEENGATIPENARQAALNATPPLDIRRKFASLAATGISTKRFILKFPSNDVEASLSFSFRDPVEVAVDLVLSHVYSFRGPVRDLLGTRCDTGRMPNIATKIQEFAAVNNIDLKDPNEIILVVSLYSDDTQSASGNVQFCPLWLSLISLDPDVRFLEREYAHGLVAVLADQKAIEYRFIGNSDGSPQLAELSLSKAQRLRALTHFKKLQLELLLQKIASIEERGRLFNFNGLTKRVRVIVGQYVSDMKERRQLLALQKNVYHCMWCYGFPGKDGDAQSKELGVRTVGTDEHLRAQFRNGKGNTKETDLKKEFREACGKLGFSLQDSCPFTEKLGSRVFTSQGPYELFGFDALHSKDGIILYYFKFLTRRLGNSFIEQSERFGNFSLGTKRDAMHIMERSIESFHFIPSAIIFGDFPLISQAERQELYLGTCDLLLILQYLVDPCPLLIIDDLRLAINRFEKHVRSLLDRINPVHEAANGKTKRKKSKTNDEDKVSRVTTKMHELFEHIADEICIFGLPNAYSSKLFETFHQDIKEMFRASSMRRSEGSAFREIVMTSFYRAAMHDAMLEISQASQLISVLPGSPWEATSRFVIANNDADLTLPKLSVRNVKLVLAKVFQCPSNESAMNTLPMFAPASRFGSTLKMWIHCALRDKPASHESVAVVPGTSQGQFFRGGAYNAIEYQALSEYEDIESMSSGDDDHIKVKPDKSDGVYHCSIKNCTDRHHDTSFQLHCSAARVADSRYGLPILFFDQYALVWPFENVFESSSVVLPKHQAILEVVCRIDCTVLVPFESIRGVCMFKPLDDFLHERKCMLFTGRNVFGHATT